MNVFPRGGSTGQQRTVTKDEPFPPTQKSGQGYVRVQPSLRRGKHPDRDTGKRVALVMRAIASELEG